MKKIIFKGIINGKEFDTVQDYNEEMNRLLGAGEFDIDAKSETRVVENPEAEVEDEHNKGVQPGFDVEDYLPNDNKYLDDFVTNDKDLNKKKLDYLKDKTWKSYNRLEKDLKNMSVDNAFYLINTIKNLKDDIENDKKDNDMTKFTINQRMEADANKLEFLESAEPFIDLLLSYYTEAFNTIRKHLLSL